MNYQMVTTLIKVFIRERMHELLTEPNDNQHENWYDIGSSLLVFFVIILWWYLIIIVADAITFL